MLLTFSPAAEDDELVTNAVETLVNLAPVVNLKHFQKGTDPHLKHQFG
jgi:hypothetical protein